MKTVFTNDCSTSFTIKWLFWQFVTTDALHVFKGEFLMIQVINYLSIASVHFLINIKFKFIILNVMSTHDSMTMGHLLVMIIGLQLYSLCTLHLNRLSSWLNLGLLFLIILNVFRLLLIQSLVLLNGIVLRLSLNLYSVESLWRWLNLMVNARTLLDLIEVRSVVMNFCNIYTSLLE